MNVISTIAFKKISRVSPSQFHSMKNCAYKSLLAEAFEKKSLLPVSPNAYLGTVLHKMLELISRGEIKNETEFNLRFDCEILLMENKLKELGYDFFVPLQMNVRDFGMKKIQLKKHLRNAAASPREQTGINFISEKWLESKDKLVGGRMDLIIEEADETEIIDFKTGAITEDVFDDNGETYLEVKNEYQEQLKLYAYLYFDSTGKFPTQLSLVDLAKQKFNVEFTEEECKSVFEEAKNLLTETNKSIDTTAFKANPSETNCKFCLYRPACKFYLQFLTTENYFNDVCGLVKDVVQYQNGNVSVFVEKGNNKISVTGFTTDKFEYFNRNRNKQINLFNLRKEATEFVYSATKTTKIYE
jgi:CRISPR/Cas system-associated exonuclease Cas4 (RecB family)